MGAGRQRWREAGGGPETCRGGGVGRTQPDTFPSPFALESDSQWNVGRSDLCHLQAWPVKCSQYGRVFVEIPGRAPASSGLGCSLGMCHLPSITTPASLPEAPLH